MSWSELIGILNSANADAFWKEFLEQYSAQIMSVAAQFEARPDQRSDCFLYVCEKLSEQNFRRLRDYELGGRARFRNWLKVVVANLCIDWKRHREGRVRPFVSIAKLPRLEQLIFRYLFMQGMDRTTCLATLQGQFPELNERRFSSAVSRVNQSLTPQQRWLVSQWHVNTVSIDDPMLSEPASRAAGPEEVVGAGEQAERLAAALSLLSPPERLILQLRYQQDLSLKEIARMARLGDPFRARREVQKALAKLAKLLEA